MTAKLDLAALFNTERAKAILNGETKPVSRTKPKIRGEKEEFRPMRTAPLIKEPPRVGPDAILTHEQQDIFHHLKIKIKQLQKENQNLQEEILVLRSVLRSKRSVLRSKN